MDFFRKILKNVEKVKNDENGSNINEKAKKEYFWIFPEKYGNISEEVKNDENGSDIDENGQN